MLIMRKMAQNLRLYPFHEKQKKLINKQTCIAPKTLILEGNTHKPGDNTRYKTVQELYIFYFDAL